MTDSLLVAIGGNATHPDSIRGTLGDALLLFLRAPDAVGMRGVAADCHEERVGHGRLNPCAARTVSRARSVVATASSRAL